MIPAGGGRAGGGSIRGAVRLTDPKDFVRVRRGGRSYVHSLAVLHIRANGLTQSRYGVTTDRGLTGSVRRNRAKRRTREALRRILPNVRSGWDMVVVARPAAISAEFSRIDAALQGLLVRSGVLDPQDDIHD